MEKRPLVDVGDLIVLIGTVLVGLGLFLMDWRLLLVWVGLWLISFGVMRLGNIRR